MKQQSKDLPKHSTHDLLTPSAIFLFFWWPFPSWAVMFRNSMPCIPDTCDNLFVIFKKVCPHRISYLGPCQTLHTQKDAICSQVTKCQWYRCNWGVACTLKMGQSILQTGACGQRGMTRVLRASFSIAWDLRWSCVQCINELNLSLGHCLSLASTLMKYHPMIKLPWTILINLTYTALQSVRSRICNLRIPLCCIVCLLSSKFNSFPKTNQGFH